MPVPSTTKKLSKTLMRAEVYADLRAWIIDGTLKPGEKLRDAELAGALGVSRMPVREAFLLVREAGGTVTALEGGPFDLYDHQVLATNGHLHEPMREVITATLRSIGD